MGADPDTLRIGQRLVVDFEDHEVRATFIQDDKSYFDCVPGGIRFPGTSGVQGWYDLLGALLPDLKVEITHEYDTIGCCLREMTATGTHSLIKQMKGEEAPPLIGLLEEPRILEHASVKSVHKRS